MSVRVVGRNVGRVKRWRLCAEGGGMMMLSFGAWAVTTAPLMTRQERRHWLIGRRAPARALAWKPGRSGTQTADTGPQSSINFSKQISIVVSLWQVSLVNFSYHYGVQHWLVLRPHSTRLEYSLHSSDTAVTTCRTDYLLLASNSKRVTC